MTTKNRRGNPGRNAPTPHEAREILTSLGIPVPGDFHTLHSSQVDELLMEAKRLRYRKPASASGSRGRYFHDYLQRIAKRLLVGGPFPSRDLGMREHWAEQAKRYGGKRNPSAGVPGNPGGRSRNPVRNPWYVGYRQGVAEVFWADSAAEVANLSKGFPEGWLGPYSSQKQAEIIARGGRSHNPRDQITLRGMPARVLADLSLSEVRRHNPELAAEIDAAGGVSVASVDVGGGSNELAVLQYDGSLVPLDDLQGGGDFLEDAFAVSEEFHGRAPRYVQGVEEQLRYSEALTDLGLLIELGIYSETDGGKPAETPLQFSAAEKIRLATNPEKNQLFIVGPVNLTQRTLGRLGVDPAEFDKQQISIGAVIHIVYRTRKKQHHWKKTDYIHRMGEERGTLPVLLYDRLNDNLSLAGGTYQISERGIIN